MKILVIKTNAFLKPDVMNRISESFKRDFHAGKPITIGPGMTYEIVEADDVIFSAPDLDSAQVNS